MVKVIKSKRAIEIVFAFGRHVYCIRWRKRFTGVMFALGPLVVQRFGMSLKRDPMVFLV